VIIFYKNDGFLFLSFYSFYFLHFKVSFDNGINSPIILPNKIEKNNVKNIRKKLTIPEESRVKILTIPRNKNVRLITIEDLGTLIK